MSSLQLLEQTNFKNEGCYINSYNNLISSFSYNKFLGQICQPLIITGAKYNISGFII